MIVALLFALQQHSQQLPAIEHPGADPLIEADRHAACPQVLPTDRGALLALEARQSDRKALGNDADAWNALGCTRAALSGMNAISREGTLMIAGDSWALGAINALAHAMTLRAGDSRSAELLAVLAMNEPEPKGMGELAVALDRAVTAGAKGNATLRACADFGIRSGHADITRRCATRALANGQDSTWHSLLMARLDFRDADSAAGTRAFIAAAGAAHDTLAKLAMAWHLQWFVSPEERKAWAALGNGGRDAWVRSVLAARDIRDARPPGARLAEHFHRFEYADSAFRMDVPRILRTSMLTKPSTGVPLASAGTAAVGGVPNQLDAVGTMLVEQPFRDYMRWQVDFDDRGVIWMRFGKPLKVHVGPDIEVWYYEIDGKPLLVTFVYEEFAGSAAPTRLATGRIGEIYCGMDTWRCQLGMRPRVNPELIRQVKEQDAEYIAAATTRDDNSVRTDRAIEVISRMHRLWDPISGAPLALLTYALKTSDLVVQPEGSARTARVEFELRRYNAATNEFQDTSFARRFTTTVAQARHLTGFAVLSSAASVSSWSLVATQSTNRRGRAWDVDTGPLDRGDEALSDLVLGQDGQGISWVNHNETIPLAPLNGVDRKLPVALYYQVRSAAAIASQRTTVALYRINSGVVADTAALQLGFQQGVQKGINEVATALDVSNLEKGSYRLEVRIADPRGGIITRRTVQLDLE